MKRSHLKPYVKSTKRRGALFHYYMAYVTLVSSVMMMAGTCLHTILQSEQADQRVSMLLHALLRCERSLRADAETATPVVASDSDLMITRPDGVKIHWSADRGILTRKETLGDETLGSDRFLFPAGSKIEITARDDGATVIRFSEPSIFVKYSSVGSGALNRNKPVDEAFPATPAAAVSQPPMEIILR